MSTHASISLIVVFGFALSGGCASGTFRVDSAKKRALSVAELIAGHEQYARELARRQEVIISVKKGEVIPMDLTLDTGIVSLKNREQLTVVRDLCVLISQKTVALSPDCRTFASMGNGRALRKLFRMGKGSVSVGLSLDEKGVHLPVLIRQK